MTTRARSRTMGGGSLSCGHRINGLACLVVIVLTVSCSPIKAEVFSFGQEYSQSLELQTINNTQNIFLICEVPKRGVLFQMSAYFQSREQLYLQIWRPTGESGQFVLQFSMSMAAKELHNLNTMDLVSYPDDPRDDPRCPNVEPGDMIGLYSSGETPIPFYRNAIFDRILHQESKTVPREGQTLAFRELRPMGRIRFVAKFLGVEAEDDDDSGSMHPPRGRHGSAGTGNTGVCTRGMRSMPGGWKPATDMLRPTGGSITRNPYQGLPGGWKPATDVLRPTGGSITRNPYQDNGDDTVGDFSDDYRVEADKSLGGSTAEQSVGAISQEVMYVIIGSVSSIVVVLILGITVCVICSRKKQQAAPPVTPRPGGVPFHSQKNASFPGHSVMKPRRDYTKEPRARIQNAANDYLDLRQVRSEEVYDEIPDNKLEDWKGIERRSPYPERGSRPVSEAGTRPLNLSDTKDEPTYLSLVG